MTENYKTCWRCGLIQPYDMLWGFMLCDSKDAFLFGCPSKELVNQIMPELEYDLTIIPVERKPLSSLFFAANDEGFK